MNKYAIVRYYEWPRNTRTSQEILLRYNKKINKIIDEKGIPYSEVLQGIKVISERGVKRIEFLGDKFRILFGRLKDREYYLEIGENETLFEAENDDDAKLIFEVKE